MTSSRFRKKRPRFNGSPSDHAPTEQWLGQLKTDPADGTTIESTEQPETGILYVNADAPRGEPLARLRAEPRYQPAAGPQSPPVTGRVLDTLNYLRLKVAILEAAGDGDRIDASEQGRRDGQQLLSWSPLRQIRDDAVALLRRGTP